MRLTIRCKIAGVEQLGDCVWAANVDTHPPNPQEVVLPVCSNPNVFIAMMRPLYVPDLRSQNSLEASSSSETSTLPAILV